MKIESAHWRLGEINGAGPRKTNATLRWNCRLAANVFFRDCFHPRQVVFYVPGSELVSGLPRFTTPFIGVPQILTF